MMQTFLDKHYYSLISGLYVLALASALFHTGNNIEFFSLSYLFITLAIALFLHYSYTHAVQVTFNLVSISLVLLLSWLGVHIFLSQVTYLSLINFFWVGSIVIIFLLFSFQTEPQKIWQSVWPALIVLVSAWALYGCVQFLFLEQSANATFLNRNSLAALVNLLLIPACGYFLVADKIKTNRFTQPTLLAAVIFILFLTLFFIKGRGATLSLVISLSVVIIFLFKAIPPSRLLKLFALITLAYIASYLIVNLLNLSHEIDFNTRMLTLKETDQATAGRTIIWHAAWQMFENIPWYGIGLGSFWLFFPPFSSPFDKSAGYFVHNDYLQIAIEAGIPGFILLMLALIVFLITFVKTLRKQISIQHKVEIVVLFAALLAFADHSFITYNFYILPLLLIAGFYLARFNQLCSLYTGRTFELPGLKQKLSPVSFYISLAGLCAISLLYFFNLSITEHYMRQADELDRNNQLQSAHHYYQQAQQATSLMDSPFFRDADLLRRAANRLLSVNNNASANELITLANQNLDTAEKLNPMRPRIFHIRALLHQKQQPELAIHYFRHALKLNPRFVRSRVALANLYHSQNMFKEYQQTILGGLPYFYPLNPSLLAFMEALVEFGKRAKQPEFTAKMQQRLDQYQQAFQQQQKR